MRGLYMFLSAALLAISSVFSHPCLAAQPEGVGWGVEKVEVTGAGENLLVRIVYVFLPGGRLSSNTAFSVIPAVTRRGGRSWPLTPVSFYGAKVPGDVCASYILSEHRLPVPQTSFRHVVLDTIPFRDWMDTVSVVIRDGTWTKRGGWSERSSRELAKVCRPPKPKGAGLPWRVLEPPVPKGTSRDVELSCRVSFDGDDRTFIPRYDAYRDTLDEFVRKVGILTGDKRYAVRSASLVLYDAPSTDVRGSVSSTRRRVQAVGAYLRKAGAFRRISPSLVGGGPDWEGFLGWMHRSRFMEDARVAELIGSASVQDEVVGRLKLEKPVMWDALDTLCFPSLRRMVFRTSFRSLQFRTPGFVLPVYEDIPEALSPRDFWFLSTDYDKSSAQWLDIMLTGAGIYPEDPWLNLNAAFGLMSMGKYNRAAVYLRNGSRFARGPLSSEAEYARAVWFYGMGRYSEFLSVLEELKDASPFYRDVWDRSVPFVMWERNLLPFVPVVL